MRPLGQSMIARRENITRPLEFRVTGGDDHVDALDAGRSTRSAGGPVAGDGHRSARLCRTGSARRATRRPPRRFWPARASSCRAKPASRCARQRCDWTAAANSRPALKATAGRSASACRRPSCPLGSCWTSLAATRSRWSIATASAAAEENWQFRVQADSPPSAVIDQPKGDFFVTPRARRGPANGCPRRPGAAAGGSRVFAHPARRPARNVASALRRTAASRRPRAASCRSKTAGGDRRTIDRRWDLEDLKLQPGTQIVGLCRCDRLPRADRPQRAADDRHRHSGRIARPPGRAAGQNPGGTGPLAATSARSPRRVRAVELRLQESGSTRNRAKSISCNRRSSTQREIARGLTDRDDGASALAMSVLADLETSRIDNPDCARRMQGLLDEFDRLQREHLVPIGDELTAAVKGVQIREQSSPRPPVRPRRGRRIASCPRGQAPAGRDRRAAGSCFPNCGSGTTIGGSSGTWPSLFAIRRKSPAAPPSWAGRRSAGI